MATGGIAVGEASSKACVLANLNFMMLLHQHQLVIHMSDFVSLMVIGQLGIKNQLGMQSALTCVIYMTSTWTLPYTQMI